MNAFLTFVKTHKVAIASAAAMTTAAVVIYKVTKTDDSSSEITVVDVTPAAAPQA